MCYVPRFVFVCVLCVVVVYSHNNPTNFLLNFVNLWSKSYLFITMLKTSQTQRKNALSEKTQ